MSRTYLKSSQPIPDQGMSYTYYEIENADEICRMLTHIPATRKVSIYPKTQVKKLFAPERCEMVTAAEFEELWAAAAAS